ncbi:DUF3987 domain-containing protein [Streptomyces sp. NPDC002446]
MDIAQTPGARGRGLLARFFFSLPASTLGYRKIVVQAIEPQLRPEGVLAHIDDWAGKCVGAVARIAGLLHLADRATGRWGEPIEAATVERATAIGEYYTAHALAAFDLMETNTESEKAQLVLDWIRRTKVTSFKAHELVTARRRAFPTVSSTAPALKLLEEHGYLRSVQPARNGSRGKLPAITYRVHPSLLVDGDSPARP